MKIEVTPEYVNQYYGTNKRHSNYDECVYRYFQVSFHLDGYYMKPTPQKAQIDITMYDQQVITNPMFSWLIDRIRPGESTTIKNYRRNIYLPKSKNPVHKVYNILRKILKSPDWAINFPEEHIKEKSSSPIKEDNSLENYLTKLFPFFDSIENWFFQVGMRSMLTDANAMVVVMPLEWPNEENQGELLNPFPYIISSKDVYEYKENKICVFKGPNVHTWTDANGNKKQSVILIIATQDEMYEAYKEDEKDQLILNLVWEHNIGSMPVWPIGGEITQFTGTSTVYDSFLEPMMPDLNDMVRRFSDHQAEIIQHVYSTMWYISQQQCNNCQGKGMVLKAGKQVNCPQCGGDGALNNTPFGSFKIKAPDKSKLENYQMVTPPAGYISKPIDMVKLQEEMIDRLSNNALSAVNMEFLGEDPLVQSGKAKAYDQDAGNAFIHKVANHIVEHIFNPAIFFINRIRYQHIVQNPEKLDEMLPTVNIPDSYDLVTESMLENKLIGLKSANVDPDILSQAKRDYIAKKFQNTPDVLKMFDLKLKHNPFPSDTLQNVLDKESAGLIEKVDAVKYCYLDDFCETLQEEHDDLFDADYETVEGWLDILAQDKLDNLSAANQVEQLSNMVEEIDPETKLPTGRMIQRSIGATDNQGTPADVPARIKNKKSGKARKQPTGLRNA